MTTCTYCGEAEGSERIMNPNNLLDVKEEVVWLVCKDCKDVIKAQQKLSIAMILDDENMARKCQKEIEEISVRTKRPVLNAMIFKDKKGNYDSMSVEYTGEEVKK